MYLVSSLNGNTSGPVLWAEITTSMTDKSEAQKEVVRSAEVKLKISFLWICQQLSFSVAKYSIPSWHQRRNQHTKTLAQVCLLVNENLGRHDIPKGHKHLQQVLVSKLLGQVIDEQVGSLWTFKYPLIERGSVLSILISQSQWSLIPIHTNASKINKFILWRELNRFSK